MIIFNDLSGATIVINPNIILVASMSAEGYLCLEYSQDKGQVALNPVDYAEGTLKKVFDEICKGGAFIKVFDEICKAGALDAAGVDTRVIDAAPEMLDLLIEIIKEWDSDDITPYDLENLDSLFLNARKLIKVLKENEC